MGKQEDLYRNNLEKVKLALEIDCINVIDEIRKKYKGEETNVLEGIIHSLKDNIVNMYEDIYLSRDHLNHYQYKMWKFGLKLIEKYDLSSEDFEELQKILIFDPFKKLEEQFDGPPIKSFEQI